MTIEPTGLGQAKKDYFIRDERESVGIMMDCDRFELTLLELENAAKAPRYRDSIQWIVATLGLSAAAATTGFQWLTAVLATLAIGACCYTVWILLEAWRKREAHSVTAKSIADKYRKGEMPNRLE